MLLVLDRLERVNTALQDKSLQFGHAVITVKVVKGSVGQLPDDLPCFWSDFSTKSGEIKVGETAFQRDSGKHHVVMQDPMHMSLVLQKISTGNGFT